MVQAARQAAEQRSEELLARVGKLTEQAVDSAAEAQRSLDAAVQKAAKDSQSAEVYPLELQPLLLACAIACMPMFF